MLIKSRQLATTDRAGFTLVEVIVAVLLIATLAAAVVPTMRGRIREGYDAALLSELDNLASGIQAYRQNVGHYPPSLDYLNVIPSGGVDACLNTLTSAQLANFRGPYITRTIANSTPNYVFGDKDTVNITLGRDSGIVFTNGPIGVNILINVDGVDSTTADDIDKRVDGSANGSFGNILWANRAKNTRLTYRIPIRPNTC